MHGSSPAFISVPCSNDILWPTAQWTSKHSCPSTSTDPQSNPTPPSPTEKRNAKPTSKSICGSFDAYDGSASALLDVTILYLSVLANSFCVYNGLLDANILKFMTSKTLLKRYISICTFKLPAQKNDSATHLTVSSGSLVASFI